MHTRLLAAPIAAVLIGLLLGLTLIATSASDAVIGVSLVLAVFVIAAITVWSVLTDPHSQP